MEIASEQLLFTWNIVFGGLNRVKTKSEFLNRILKFHVKETTLTNQEEFFLYFFLSRQLFSKRLDIAQDLLDKFPSTLASAIGFSILIHWLGIYPVDSNIHLEQPGFS